MVPGGRTVERVAELMDEGPKQFAGSVPSGKEDEFQHEGLEGTATQGFAQAGIRRAFGPWRGGGS